MRFDQGAWDHAATVLQSEGYEHWMAWMVTVMPREWLNGLAAKIANQRPTLRDWDDLAEEEILEIAARMDQEAIDAKRGK